MLLPDYSPSFPITLSSFFSLQYIMAGILKREKEQNPVKASKNVLQISKYPNIFLSVTHFCHSTYISIHRQRQDINYFYGYCKDQS